MTTKGKRGKILVVVEVDYIFPNGTVNLVDINKSLKYLFSDLKIEYDNPQIILKTTGKIPDWKYAISRFYTDDMCSELSRQKRYEGDNFVQRGKFKLKTSKEDTIECRSLNKREKKIIDYLYVELKMGLYAIGKVLGYSPQIIKQYVVEQGYLKTKCLTKYKLTKR